MMSDLLCYYRIHRNIFGVCPECQNIFRLSDCNIYLRKKPKRDWLDEFDREENKIEGSEDRLDKQEQRIREAERVKARRAAQKSIRRIDTIFSPRNIDPEDVRLLFHPVDYMVFRGMKTEKFKSILLLDRSSPSKDRQALQRSIAKTIKKKNYDWLTLRIDNRGQVWEE